MFDFLDKMTTFRKMLACRLSHDYGRLWNLSATKGQINFKILMILGRLHKKHFLSTFSDTDRYTSLSLFTYIIKLVHFCCLKYHSYTS